MGLKIAVDMDDVLMDMARVVLNFHNQKYGTNHKYEEKKEYGLHETWKVTYEEAIKKVDEFYDSEEFKKVLPFPDVKDHLKQLSQEHALVVVTNRPHHITEKTHNWTNQHFSHYFSKIILTNGYFGAGKVKKSEVCRQEGCKIIIDDALHNAIDCAENGIVALLLDKPWNQCEKLHSNIIRVYNWKEIVEKINLLQQALQ